MHQTDIGIFLLFTAFIFICGISFSKSGKNVNSFFAAGGALPWWMSGLSLFMSFFSAGTFVVWGSIAYSSGWVAVSIQWTMAIAGIIIGTVIAPKWQKTKVLTAASFITKRLGLQTQKVYTYLFLFVSVFTTGAFLYPVAKIVEVSTGFPIVASIIGLGMLILLYTAVGGLWAVIVTDVLQFVVLTAAVLIVLPLSFKKVGGISSFMEKAPDGFFNMVTEEYSVPFLIAFGLYNLFFIAGNWAYVQRYTSVSTTKDAKKVGWLFGALYIISPVVWMIPPMIYRVLNPDLEQLADEGAYLLMCKEVMPLGLLGLMLGGMVFATSSSVNTTLNISAGVIANDIYKALFPEASNAKLVYIGRISTVVLGLLTIVIALLVPLLGGIVEVVMSIAALTGAAMFLPPLWALFSKRSTGKSTILVTMISLSINAFFKFLAPLLLSIKLNRTSEMMLGVFVPVTLLVIIELVQYFLKQEAPLVKVEGDEISITSEVAEDNTKGSRIIGMGVGVTGLLILLLSLLAGDSTSTVAVVGLPVLLIGIFIFYKNRTLT